MDQIVLARQETISADTAPVDQAPGIRPSIRRWVAPDMIQPHTAIAVPRPASGDSLIPMQPDSPPVTENTAESTVLPHLQKNESEEVPDVPVERIQSNGSDIPAVRRIEESTDARETRQSELINLVPSDVTRSTTPEETAESLGKEISSGLQSHKSADFPEKDDTPTLMVEKKSELPEMIFGFQKTSPPGIEDSIEVPDTAEERQESQKQEILHKPEEVRSTIPLTDAIGFPDTVLRTGQETRDTRPVPEAEPLVPSVPSSHVNEDVVWPIIHVNKPASLERSSPQESDLVKREEIPFSPTPSPLPGSIRQTIFVVIAVCAVILAIASGALFYSQYLAGNHTKPSIPEIIPTPTISQIPTIPEVMIPTSGIWVRVKSNSTFLGSVGIPGSLKVVSGSGSQFYRIQRGDSGVQVSFQKQEYTGDPMTVEIYNNGILMAYRTITAPRGTIDFIIDPKTGNPPGISSNHT